MDYNYLREDSDFHKWHKYAPLDTQYIKYAESNPSVIAVGHKIDDVYPDAALCEAKVPLRFLLRYQGQNNMLIERSGVVSGGVELEDTHFDEQQSGDVTVEDSAVIETPADLADGDVTAVVKKPNTEVVDQQVENIIVIETPVSAQEQEK